jgi:hypothetical protein
MSEAGEFIRSRSEAMDASELLTQSVTILIGVSPVVAAALADVGIQTVFDLGCSRIFMDAKLASSPAQLGEAARHGRAPGDLLEEGAAADVDGELGGLPLNALRSITAEQGAALSAALDVANLADLARWPAYVFANRLVSGAVGGAADIDARQTERLRPTFGEFPTERIYYSTLAMLHMDESPDQGLKSLDGGVPLDTALATSNGFQRPAVGALLTYSQSWYVQGITFGHLLHSLALAPGEATRIAIVDWSRTQRATTSESISESEELASAASHARALSEVQSAVASEMQEGGSMSTSHAESSNYSAQASVGTGLLTSLWASGDVSGSTSGATTDTTANSSSWSIGNRSVGASMSQNINDRTEQHSTSARNRRATAVREVSQSEHEQISTRIVANYNHMHALTIQYYEIVQVYRVATRLHRAERCLFVPMRRIDFSEAADGARYVERFRGALLAAALSPRVRDLLRDEASSVKITPLGAGAVRPFGRPDVRADVTGITTAMKADAAAEPAAAAMRKIASVLESSPANSAATMRVVAEALEEVQVAKPVTAATAVRVSSWDLADLAVASRAIAKPIVRPGSNALFVPDDAELLSITFDGVTVDKLRLDRVDPAAADSDLTLVNGRVDLAAGVRLGDLDAIHASRAGGTGSGRMTLLCTYLGRRFALPAMPVELGSAITRIASFATDGADRRRELLAHLQANAAHYTNAVLRSLDSASLVLLLSDYEWNGRPLIEQVEPKPLSVAGNYLVLRAPADAEDPSGIVDVDGSPTSWKDLLDDRGFEVGEEPDSRVIPIPTNGVFAEAVLGRSNSAEKLEYTRFWNWQDSPIPLAPTEIAPVSAGSRAIAENLTPGQLGQPVLNIVTPTSLPDPTGVGAALQAVVNGQMFRDMAGLAGTQNLAAQTAKETVGSAASAAEITSANMRAQMQKAVAMGQIAADLAKTAMGMPSSGGGNQSVSAEAARVAHGESRDATVASGASTDAGAAAVGGGGGGASDGGEATGGGSGGGASFMGAVPAVATAAGGAGDAAFRRALWGETGMPRGELASNAMALAGQLGAASGTAIGAAPANASPFSTKLFPSPFAPSTAQNTRLATALTTVRAGLAAARRAELDKAALLVARLTPSGSMEYAGVHESDMYFSGSLLKVSLLYASFELVARVNAIAPSIVATTEADFFAELDKRFGPTIAGAIPNITSGAWQKVTWAQALRALPTGGGFTVQMHPTHRADIERIFANQNQNDAARDSMHRLGYSYVDGALAAAGFYGAQTQRGVWMATDYISDDPAGPGNWRSFNIPVVTGTGATSSAAMTCVSMAALLGVMHRGELVDPAASTEMRAILRRGGSWVSTIPNPGVLSFTEQGAKVGHSSSGSAGVGTVMSEAAFLRRTSDGADFVAVWQNVPDALGAAPVFAVIDELIKNWP